MLRVEGEPQAQPGTVQNSKSGEDFLGLPGAASATPLTVREKFHQRVIQTFGIRGFGGSLISASISQATGTPYDWGGGMEGFGKRYASAFGGNLSRQTMSFVLEAALHEDPRYFPMGANGTFSQRLSNAIKQVFVARTDSGKTSPAYGKLVSAFAAGQLVNAWQPGSNGKVSDGLERGVYSLGGDLAFNLAQEFIPFARSKATKRQINSTPKP